MGGRNFLELFLGCLLFVVVATCSSASSQPHRGEETTSNSPVISRALGVVFCAKNFYDELSFFVEDALDHFGRLDS